MNCKKICSGKSDGDGDQLDVNFNDAAIENADADDKVDDDDDDKDNGDNDDKDNGDDDDKDDGDDDDKDDGDEWEILEEGGELSCRQVRRSFLLGEEKGETSYYQLLSLRSLSRDPFCNFFARFSCSYQAPVITGTPASSYTSSFQCISISEKEY